MKRFSEQLKKKSDSIRLRATERADLRARLESYMEYHPLPAELSTPKKTVRSTKSKVQGIVSEPFKTIAINMTYVRSAIGIFAVFVVVAVPVLAERSMPGDVLYPVKTNINEEVRSSLTLSPYAKIEWETKRLERRVAEARLLASEGKLTPETEAVVAQAVKAHTDAVTQGIAGIREINEDDAAIAEIAFASALSVQADALEGYVADSDSAETSDSNPPQDGHSVAVLVDTLNNASDDADTAQQDASPSYEALLEKVESQTTQAYETFASVESQANDTEKKDIRRRFADIERKVTQAIALYTQDTVLQTPEESAGHTASEAEVSQDRPIDAPTDTEIVESVPDENGDYNPTNQENATATPRITDVQTEIATPVSGEQVTQSNKDSQSLVIPSVEERHQQAVDSLRTILSDLQKLIIFMTDIDVRENLTVEDLVPVTLSKEEQIKNINDTLANTAQIQERITSQEIRSDIEEKVIYGLRTVDERTVSASTARDADAYQQAQQLADEAYAMILDIDQLIAQQKIDADIVAGDTASSVREGIENQQDTQDMPLIEEDSPDVPNDSEEVIINTEESVVPLENTGTQN